MNIKSNIVKKSFFDSFDLFADSKVKNDSLWLTEVVKNFLALIE